MNSFLKWLTTTCILSVLIFIAQSYFGFFTLLSTNDLSYLSYVIWGIFGLGVCVSLSEGNTTMIRTDLLSEKCMKVGLLGTVIGLALTFYNISLGDHNMSNPDVVTELTNLVFAGMGTAFTSTITGLVASLALHSYVLILCKEDNDEE